MQLPLLRQLKRLLPFLLGIGTTLLILGLSLHPITAQQSSVLQAPPAFGTLPKGGRGDLIAQTNPSINPSLNLVQQGKTAYQKGQLNQSITLWKQASDAFAAQGDRLHQAMTLSYLAQAYQQRNDWENAKSAIAQSLQLLKQPTQGSGDRLRILAEAQTIQGSLQLDQGQASEAYASWEQALNAFQTAGDRAGVVRSQLNQSQALLTLGLYKRANNLLASLYKTQPLEEPLQLGILLNYGETLRSVGRLQDDPLAKSKTENSEAVLKQGLELAQKLKTPADITKAQISLGNTYRAIYKQQKRLQPNPCPDPIVLAYRTKALASYQAAAAGTDPTSKIQALLNQQSLLMAPQSDTESISTEQVDQVQAIVPQIQTELKRLPVNRTALYTRIQLAYNLLKLDQMPSKLKDGSGSDAAIQLLNTAIEQAKTLGDGSAQSYALGYLGQAYEQQQKGGDAQQQTAQALTLTTKALNLAKTLNAPEIAYRWFWQMGRLDRATNPEQAIRDYKEAYSTLQLIRTDLLSDNSEMQFSFQEHPVEQAYREYADLLLQPTAVGTKELQKSPETQQEKLQTAREVMRSLQITELQNFLQQPCSKADLAVLDQLTNAPDSATAILHPIILHDRIEVIAKLPNQDLVSHSFNVPDVTVKATIAQFQQDVQESYTFDAVKEDGQTLYKWLIEPVRAQLESAQIKTIVFVLDAPLRNIPMSALYDGAHYLIENYAVSVSLGLDLSNPQKLPNDHLKVLAASLANPSEKFHTKFAKLDYVTKELEAIKTTQSIAMTPLQEGNFNRTLFNNKLSNAQFDIVHLATHGQFSSNPQETFILTAPITLPNGKLSDGKIRLSDFDEMFRTRVLNRADAIELLILSACETASGDDRATLGIAGAAIKAGARSAIASLWSLDDESSQLLITTFYKTITQPGTSRAEALRQAQLALLQEQGGAYTHPRHWAPFLLAGSWL